MKLVGSFSALYVVCRKLSDILSFTTLNSSITPSKYPVNSTLPAPTPFALPPWESSTSVLLQFAPRQSSLE